MRVIESVAEMTRRCREVARPLGLVPTMGALHQGHLSLVRRALAECASVAVSIFVNPTQFGPGEDYATYPRDLKGDLALLEAEGVHLAFTPPVEEMYPPDFDAWVEPGRVAQRLEGEYRPGHFRGVVTVVAQLLNLVRPDRAYLGQKDGQQVAVVQRLLADLRMGVELVVVPTVREPDGLALSSRNRYLTPEERRAASVLYRSLCQAQRLYQEGVRDAERLRQAVRRTLEQEPLVQQVDYVSVAHRETLEELERVEPPAMVSLAVRIGRVRLIDNLVLEEGQQ